MTQYPYVTGTSVIALQYKDGVIMASDTGASYGSTLRYKSVERIKAVGSSKESSITNGPFIVPLKRTLQERVVKTESCYLCGNDVDGEKDFRGMYCAVLTTSSLVVSAAILKVRTEEIAELVLIATRNGCRKKGYFTLLLRLIEAHLKAWNVRFLTAPIDPEMESIWSEKLGFTILSDEEKKSLLEAHPLVMFENLRLAQKSLA